MKRRKEIFLIVLGAGLAITSFCINWAISASIEKREMAIGEELEDIDRHLTFTRSAALEAFQHRATAKNGWTAAQLLYFQVQEGEWDESRTTAYTSMVADIVNQHASAVSAAHVAAVGKTIEGSQKQDLLELANESDPSRAIAGLSAMFSEKMFRYQAASEERVLTRRKLLVEKKELEATGSLVRNVSHLIQLLGLLIILTRDVVANRKLQIDEEPAVSNDEPTIEMKSMAA